MKLHRFGNPNADIVLIQPVDDHDLEGIENEVSVIAESCGRNFFLIACQVEDWNKDLSISAGIRWQGFLLCGLPFRLTGSAGSPQLLRRYGFRDFLIT